MIPEQFKDQIRGAGRTTRQMVGAPRYALFIWCTDDVEYATQLAAFWHRQDLRIKPRHILRRTEQARGQTYSALVIDHAVDVEPIELHNLSELMSRVRSSAATDAVAATRVGDFQSQVREWVVACFGPATANDRRQRTHRFVEEALELAQSCGCSRSDAHALVDYAFGRPVGYRPQEVGGALLTLAALCSAHDISLAEAGEIELSRVWTKLKSIRAKQAAKVDDGPLPGPSALA